jgi:hypothetical protein
MNLRSRMTTTNPIRKMMPTALPRNLSMGSPERLIPENERIGRAEPSVESDGGGRRIGSREWDRTTDHLHVKEVLYH